MNNFYKCEYERLRRNKNKEIALIKRRYAMFMNLTWDLLKVLGLSEKEILDYYRRANEIFN